MKKLILTYCILPIAYCLPRKMIYLLYYGILFIAYCQLPTADCLGQPSENIYTLKPKHLKKFGENAVKLGDIYSAIDYYEHYCKLKPEDYDVAFTLAELYRASRDYKQAQDWYLKTYTGDSKKYTLSLYYYALMLKMNGNYELAKENFKKFKKKYRGQHKSKSLVKNQVKGCDMAKDLIDSPINITITHLDTSINKAHIEFSPVPKDDNTLIYASLKADSIEYFAIEDNKKPIRKFYVAKKINNKWTGKNALPGPFNNDKFHTGNGAFSPDGLRFYFTRCETNWQNKVICEIYVSNNEEGKWAEPVNLGEHINFPEYTTTQPTIATDTKKKLEIIYFVSDRPRGKGGKDIWYTLYSHRKNSFSEPKNAGRKINTIGNEITPYFDPSSSTLYFSSDGLPGVGGFDVFKTQGQLSRWAIPVNIGYPVNTSVDDLYYILNKNRKEEGFFTSNRKGGTALKNETCCDDIYSFILTDYIKLSISGNIFKTDKDIDPITYLIDSIFKYINEASLEGAIVSLYMIDDETQEELYIYPDDTTDVNGEFFFNLVADRNYKIIAFKDGFFNSQINISTKMIMYSDTLYRPIGLKIIPKTAIILKDIYYEFGKATLTEESKTTIDSTILIILKQSPHIVIELSSHTDSVSSNEFNLRLSQKRAESVVNYLISKGISKDRLIPKGYGETQPVAPNTNPDGSDNTEGRALNRRTEFKVIGSVDPDSHLDIIEPMKVKKKKKN